MSWVGVGSGGNENDAWVGAWPERSCACEGLSARVHAKAYGQGMIMGANVGPRACANAGPARQSGPGALLVVVHVRPT